MAQRERRAAARNNQLGAAAEYVTEAMNGRGCSVAPWAPGTAFGWAAPATVERRAVAAARASTVACCLLLGGIPLAR
jgi:hypothetical protein